MSLLDEQTELEHNIINTYDKLVKLYKTNFSSNSNEYRTLYNKFDEDIRKHIYITLQNSEPDKHTRDMKINRYKSDERRDGYIKIIFMQSGKEEKISFSELREKRYRIEEETALSLIENYSEKPHNTEPSNTKDSETPKQPITKKKTQQVKTQEAKRDKPQPPKVSETLNYLIDPCQDNREKIWITSYVQSLPYSIRKMDFITILDDPKIVLAQQTYRYYLIVKNYATISSIKKLFINPYTKWKITTNMIEKGVNIIKSLIEKWDISSIEYYLHELGLIHKKELEGETTRLRNKEAAKKRKKGREYTEEGRRLTEEATQRREKQKIMLRERKELERVEKKKKREEEKEICLSSNKFIEVETCLERFPKFTYQSLSIYKRYFIEEDFTKLTNKPEMGLLQQAYRYYLDREQHRSTEKIAELFHTKNFKTIKEGIEEFDILIRERDKKIIPHLKTLRLKAELEQLEPEKKLPTTKTQENPWP